MDAWEGSSSSSDARRLLPSSGDGAPGDAATEAGENNTVGAFSPDTRTASAENVGALSPDTAAEANRCLFELRWALSGTLIARVKGDEWEDHMVGLLEHELASGVYAADGVPPAQLNDKGCKIEEYRLFYEGVKLSQFQRFKDINIAENGIVTVVKVKIRPRGIPEAIYSNYFQAVRAEYYQWNKN